MAKKDGKGMETPEAVMEAPVEEAERSRLFEASRKVLLAYVGGLALAWDELEDLVDRLVERGEVAETDARKLLKEMQEKRRSVGLEKRLEDLLARMDVPSKADIQALSAKIATLTQKVEELKKTQG